MAIHPDVGGGGMVKTGVREGAGVHTLATVVRSQKGQGTCKVIYDV